MSNGGEETTSQEIDREALEAFLATAPVELREWADQQLALLGTSSSEASTTDDGDAVGLEAFVDEDERPRSAGRMRARAKRLPGKVSFMGVSGVNLVLVTLLAAAVVIIIQQMGRSPHPEMTGMMPTSTVTAAEMPAMAQLDTELVAALQAQAEAEPANAEVRYRLGEVYLAAKYDQEAISWYQLALDIDPGYLDALLAIGVAEFNLELDAQAEAHWKHAIEIAPDKPEPWFNLGFLYMASTPPQQDKAEDAWNRVIELAPGSELAQNAQAHLDRIRAQASFSPSPGR